MNHVSSATIWKKDILAWSLYDFANTIYSMNIVSLYLKRYIVQDLGYPDHYFDLPFAASMLIAAVVLPALGAISDHTTKRKIFVFLFTLTCCMAVGLLAVVPAEFILGTVLLFIIANFSYEAAQPFYNSLLYSVAEGRQARVVSGLGVSVGYVGSVAGMILVLPFVSGSLYGMEIPFVSGAGKTGAFLPTALLFFLFSIPLFLLVKERPAHAPEKISMRQAYRDVWGALRNTRKYPGVFRFLIADYFFEDAAFTVILNIGLYCSIVLGLAENQITTFLIISTISAVFGAFVIGKIAERWSLKNMLTLIMYGWVVALVLFASSDSMPVIWVLGSVVGVLLGGLWTTSRPMLAELVPREELGRFFGIFALSGRAAAVVGPIVWTSIVYLFQPENLLGRWAVQAFDLNEMQAARLPYKLGVLSLAGLILIGLWFSERFRTRLGWYMGRKVGDWYHYAGAIHVHTTESDGTKTLEEVAAIGERADLDFILFTDHMNLHNRERGKEGFYGRTLALVGYEHNDLDDNNHYMLFGSPSVYDKNMTSAEYVSAGARDNAIGIIAHPDEIRDRMGQYPPYPWTDWNLHGYTGIELWNQMSEWMERLTPANKLLMAFSPRKSMVGPTDRVFAKWDEVNRTEKIVGVASVDAHAFPIKVGPFKVEIFPYKVHFRSLRTYIILPGPLSTDFATARTQVYDAIRDCRAFGAHIRWGDPIGFRFSGRNGAEQVIAGGRLSNHKGSTLEVLLPSSAVIRLVGNGKKLIETAGDKLEYHPTEPGIYRIEAWKQNRCWIFSNHIRIGV